MPMPYLMKRGILYEWEDAFGMFMDYPVIFFGEEHGSRISHEAELSILKGLAKRDPKMSLRCLSGMSKRFLTATWPFVLV